MTSVMSRPKLWPERLNTNILNSCRVPWQPAAVNSNFADVDARRFVVHGGAGGSTRMAVPAAKPLRLRLEPVSPRFFAHKIDQNVQIAPILGHQDSL